MVHSGCVVFKIHVSHGLYLQIADENDSDLRYSEVPLKGKNKTLVKILGGRQHRTTPAGRDPCNPCGVDAYGVTALSNRSFKRIASGENERDQTLL